MFAHGDHNGRLCCGKTLKGCDNSFVGLRGHGGGWSFDLDLLAIEKIFKVKNNMQEWILSYGGSRCIYTDSRSCSSVTSTSSVSYANKNFNPSSVPPLIPQCTNLTQRAPIIVFKDAGVAVRATSMLLNSWERGPLYAAQGVTILFRQTWWLIFVMMTRVQCFFVVAWALTGENHVRNLCSP
jgi:hypothetical protein